MVSFYDSSKLSFKTVLFQNGNKFAFSVSMKGTYDRVVAILNTIKFKQSNWQIYELGCEDHSYINIHPIISS